MEQAKIREAWESVLKVHFHLIEKGINSEGWYSNERNDQWLPLQSSDMHLYDFRNDNTEVRPKSLNEMEKCLDNMDALLDKMDKIVTIRNLEAQNKKLKELLAESGLQIEYLHNKFKSTGSGNNLLTRIETLLNKES